MIEARRVPTLRDYPEITVYMEDCIALAEWCGGTSHMMNNEEHLKVPTPKGVVEARSGDWIMKVDGTFLALRELEAHDADL